MRTNAPTSRGRLRAVTAALVTALIAAAAAVFAQATPAYAGTVSGVVSGNYYYVTVGAFGSTGQFHHWCFDVTGAGTADLTPMQLWLCGPQWNQQFKVQYTYDINGFPAYQLHPRYADNLCLEVNGAATYPGAGILVITCNPSWDTMFQLYKPSYTTVWQIMPTYEAAYQMCVAADGGAPYSGEPLYQDSCANSNHRTTWEIWNSLPPA